MKRQHTYENNIGEKLNELTTTPDVAALWSSMETILDKEMPQQEKKKRIGAWWFSPALLATAILLAAVSTVYTINHTKAKPAAVGSSVNKESTTPPAAPVTKTPGNEAAKPAATEPLANRKQSQTKAAAPTVKTTKKKVATKTRTASPAKPQQDKANASKPIIKEEGQKKEPETKKAPAEKEHAVTAPVIVAFNQPFDNPSLALLSPASTEPAKEAGPTLPLQNGSVLPFQHPLAKKQKRTHVYSDKGVSFGIALNYPVAVGNQRKNDFDMNAKKNAWQDYLPSAYAQLHLNKKFYLQAEWAPLAAQYTPNTVLYHQLDEPNPDEKEEKVVKLNKLFYTNIPLSFHYNTPFKNISVGLGVQYSALKKVILQDQEYYHLIGAGGWTVMERKNESVAKDPSAIRDHNGGDVVDDVAATVKKEDWHLLADAGYNYKRLSLGLRYTHGLHNAVNSNFTNQPVKLCNESLQVYLHLNLFDTRKK